MDNIVRFAKNGQISGLSEPERKSSATLMARIVVIVESVDGNNTREIYLIVYLVGHTSSEEADVTRGTRRTISP